MKGQPVELRHGSSDGSEAPAPILARKAPSLFASMTRFDSSSIAKLVGSSLIAMGVFVNKWTLELLLVPDGRIESLTLNLLLALTQLALIGIGAAVWMARWRWLTNSATALASLVVTLLALEGAFRALGIRAEYPRPRADGLLPGPDGATEPIRKGLMPFVTMRSTYASNPRGYFDSGNVMDHVHNSVGWRDVEHPVEKPPGSFRILGLGDSYLYGQGVRREDIVLTRLETLLQADARGTTIETINTGVSGYNTVDQRDLLRDRGLAYSPDLVILFYVLNDVEERLDRTTGPKIEFFVNYTSIYQEPDAASKYSYLWSWARQRVQKLVQTRRYIRESVAAFVSDDEKWGRSRGALDEIHGLAAERGIPLLVVIFPFFYDLGGDYPFQLVHDLVREHCETAGIPVLDLRDSYREYDGPELWVHPTDQHPNEIAHEIAAHAVYDFLSAHPDLLGGVASGRGRTDPTGGSRH